MDMILNTKTLTQAAFLMAALTTIFTLPALAQNSERPKPKVEVVTVEEMVIAPTIEIPGTIVSRNDARIAAEVSGRIDWIADEGAELKEGDVIARLDQRSLKLDLAEADANMKRLKADFSFQSRDAARLEDLAASGNVPKSRLDEVRSRRDMTRQALAIADIQRERIAYNLERTEVKAPFPGHMVERLVQVGEYTTVGRAVARFVDTQNVEVRAQVPVSAAPWVSAHQSIDVEHAGEIFEHTVRTVIPVGNEQSRTFEIRVGAKNVDWIVGSPVRLSVPTGEARSVLAAPRDALIIRATGVTVFKINDEGIAERVQVKAGPGKGDYLSIEGPVAAGDRLVVRGGEFLRPGQEVEILTVGS
jgi:RND family efflux transporter MFP subunit